MKSSHLALMVVGYLALSNKAMKGEKIPSFEGNIEFTGAPIVTGSLVTVVAFLLFSAILVSAFETIREWQDRGMSSPNPDDFNEPKSGELGASYSPMFTNPIVHIAIFAFNYWVPVAFGSFVIYKLWGEMGLFISKVTS